MLSEHEVVTPHQNGLWNNSTDLLHPIHVQNKTEQIKEKKIFFSLLEEQRRRRNLLKKQNKKNKE